MQSTIERVKLALAQGRPVTISMHAEHMLTFDAGNWTVGVYPGLPVTITFLPPKPGAPRLSDCLHAMANMIAQYEWKHER